MFRIGSVIVCISAIVLFLALRPFFLLPSKEGNTEGLVAKLLSLDEVVDVTDYNIYEGSASLQLLLKNNKSIALYAINNQDLVSANSIVIVGINGSNIYCRSVSGNGGGQKGISISQIEQQLLPDNDNLKNLQGVLAEFDQLEKLLSKLPLEISDSNYSDNRVLICRDESH